MKSHSRYAAVVLLPALIALACSVDDPSTGDDAPLVEEWAALTVGAVDATMSIQNDWKQGYCSTITVKNNGNAAVTGWKVSLNLRQSTISSHYSAKLDTATATFTPEAYNARIAPGSQTTFGFCANANGADYLGTIATFTAEGGGSLPGGGTGTGSGGSSGTGSGSGTAGSTGSGTAGTTGSGTGTTGSNGSGSNAGSGTATVVSTQSWDNGYCADVNAPGTNNATVVLDMRNSAIADGQLWSAAYTTSGSTVTVTNVNSKFRFCARKTASTDWLAVVRSVNGTSTGGGTGGGNTGSGGTSGGNTGGSASGGSTNGGNTGGGNPGGAGATCSTISGTNGWTSRFWDCCKPHCGWTDNGPGGKALSSCNENNQSLGSNYTEGSSCAGGGAFMCYGLTPWAVSDTLAYGYAATPTSNQSCGKCYAIQFAGRGQHGDGSDPGSVALKGKTIVVQTINVGGDVAAGQFDIMVPGGGVGLFNACSNQWNVQDSELGAQYGGLLASCRASTNYKGTLADNQNCLRNKCNSLFTDARGLSELRKGCLFYADWFMAADNPQMVYKEVACPAALQQKSGLVAGAASSNACGG